MNNKYEQLSREQLLRLLESRDREKRLGLIWERDEIEADVAVDNNFVVCGLDVQLNEGTAPWSNLVIEADNFDALRWLRMTYSSRIKCIYIDPPYNTGQKDWVYNDRYFDPNDRYRYSTWLEFLYRRLTLARDLLSQDGVILVSINDENRSRLELLMDVALPGMRLGSLVWRSRTGGNEGGKAFLSDNHEHILVYGNSAARFGGHQKTFEKYVFFDPARNDHYRIDNLTQPKDRLQRPNAFYAIHDPTTDIFYPANPTRVWAYPSKSKLKKGQKIRTKAIEDWIANDRIFFPPDQRVETFPTRSDLIAAIRNGDVPKSKTTLFLWEDMPDLDEWIGRRIGYGTPAFKRYRSELRNETQPFSSWITPNAEAETLPDTAQETWLVSGTNDEGTKAVKELFGSAVFPYPKPPSLITALLQQLTEPGDIILDFFAGSATTAQSTMELNAKDNGDRRFIMVSSTEATADDKTRNICRDITAQRIRLLNEQREGSPSVLPADFAYLRARKIMFEDFDYEVKPEEVWLIVQAMHDLPLMPYEANSTFQIYETPLQTIVYLDRVDQTGLAQIREARTAKKNLFVYSWAPGKVAEHFDAVDFQLEAVRSILVKRFQQ